MTGSLDLLIIKPQDKKKVYGALSSKISAIEPPLWAALIAAFLRDKKFSVKVIDSEAEDLSPEETAKHAKELRPLLTGFVVTGSNLSASTWHMTGAREYIRAFQEKNPGLKTFIWGLHSSALPQRTLIEEKVDFLVQGEGFSTIVDLLKALNNGSLTGQIDIPGLWYFKNGQVASGPPAGLVKDLDELPPPAWDLLPMKKYRAHNWQCFHAPGERQPYGVIYTSFGCPFNCSFCNLKALFSGSGIRYRSPGKVIGDIDILVRDYGVKNIKVLDECFVLDKKHVIDICDLIIGRGYKLNLWAYARIDTVEKELLKKLKTAGFNWLCYGIESANNKVLTQTAKRGFGKEDIKRVIKMTKEAGINILANFMFGLPEDNLETMQETLDLAKELNCEYTNFYATMAYPGSDLYQEALKNNVSLPENWRGYAAFSEECLPLPTKYLSAREVLSFRDRAFVDFHNNPKYLEMIEEKFGSDAVLCVKEMLGKKLERKFAW